MTFSIDNLRLRADGRAGQGQSGRGRFSLAGAVLAGALGVFAAGDAAAGTLACTGDYDGSSNVVSVYYDASENTCTILDGSGEMTAVGDMAIAVANYMGLVYLGADNALDGASTLATTDYATCSFAGTSRTAPAFCAFDVTTVSGQTAAISANVNDAGAATLSVTFDRTAGGSGTVSNLTASISGPGIPGGGGSSGGPDIEPEDALREVLQDEALRGLNASLGASQRMMRDARQRLIEGNEGNVALDVDGSFDADGLSVSSKGSFFQQSALASGARRLFFGDFDVQHDHETGSTTATLSGRLAWERMVDGATLFGYFVGGELARSNIDGAFEGDNDRIGLTLGGYAVHELAEKIYLDGFATIGAGRNNLEMADDVLALESDYTTRSATIGAALSGVIAQKGFEIRPELSFSAGRTWLGDLGFTGRVSGVVDNTLVLDAGTVQVLNLTFRPEFVVPLDGLSVADSKTLFSFAPRLRCEEVDTGEAERNCGAGAELGLSGGTADGLTTVSARIAADRLGGETSSSLQVTLDHRF